MGNARNGYGPNGRALKMDGTERKARTKLTEAEIVAKLAEDRRKANTTIGKGIIAKSATLAVFVAAITTFRKWVREARNFATEEARAEKRAHYEAMITQIEAKGEAAEAYLPGTADAENAILNLFSNVGRDWARFMEDNGYAPTDEDTARMVSENLSDETREIVESANDPENDPFRAFRRNAGENETEDSGEESL